MVIHCCYFLPTKYVLGKPVERELDDCVMTFLYFEFIFTNLFNKTFSEAFCKN